MKFHPSVLIQAAFLDRPRSLKELYQVVGLVEKKVAVTKERQRVGLPDPDIPLYRDTSRSGSAREGLSPGTPLKCWNCGSLGQVRRHCPR